MLQVYDRILTTYSVPTLIGISVLALIFLAMMSVVDAARQWVMIRIANRTVANKSEKLLPKALRNPEVLSPALLNGNLAKIKNYLSSGGFFALWDMPWVVFYIALIFFMHTVLGITAVVGALLLVVVAMINHFASKGSTQAAEQQAENARIILAVGNANAETVSGMRMQTSILDRWSRYQFNGMNQVTVVQQRNAFFTSLTKGVRQSLQVAILGIGAYLVIQQEILPGMMIAASIIMGRGLQPIEQSIGQWRMTRESNLAYGQIQEAEKAFPKDPEAKVVPETINGLLEVTNASYAVHPDAPNILTDINLRVAPGEVLAIFGRSGAGKSTLVKLLTGVQHPTDGTVTLDGLQLSEWPDSALGRAIGYLPQQVQLFPGTIAENIAALSLDMDSQSVIKAAQQVNAHEMIMQLPQGYETILQGGNVGVSGGQAQRIAFARAVYDDKQVIIIDEPNAALDDEGQQQLLASIQRLKALGKTLIISSHFRPVLSLSDRVVILEKGKIQLAGPTQKVIEALNNANRENAQPVASSVSSTKDAPSHQGNAT